MEPACVSGALAANLRAVLRELVGEAMVDRALLRVSRDVRDEFESVTSVGWVRISTYETVFGAIASDLSRSVADLHTEVARVSIERTMRTVWRVLLRLTTDNALISRTPVIFARSYNRGRLSAQIPVAGRAEVTLSEWPEAPDWPLRATRIGVETVLRLAGRKDVRVAAERQPDGASFVATWR
jgi:hypothetical protein